LEQLRQRLAEAEETLRAIRSGEVDALVVSGPEGDQVFSLKGAEQPYRAFVELMQEGALTLDESGTVLYSNRTFADLVQSPLQKVIGSKFESWVRESDRHDLTEAFAHAAPHKVYVFLSTAQGGLIPVRLSLSRMPVDDIEATCCVVTDLTEREEKRALESALGELRAAQERLRDQNEELLIARQTAERASVAKDRFLAALSHELRTPLTPCLMTAIALRDDPTIGEGARQDLDLIRRNIELEARLIDDLLDLTRIVNGKLELRRELVDVHVLLESALGMSQPDAAAKRLTINRRLAARRPVVLGDPVRIQQILWNLVRNAVKFTPAGGHVEIASEDAAGGDELRVSITDSGIGIDPEAMERIFTPFEQAGQEITREFGGLGLGLAISARLVELHGGRIAASSAGRNRGATFTIELPAAAGAVPDQREIGGATRHDGDDGGEFASPGKAVAGVASADGDGAASRSLRILLVEDHEDTRRVMLKLLGGNHMVRAVGTVAAALRAADAEPFDLVISDLGLPDDSGLELMRQLNRKHGLRGIALSGFGMEDDLRKSRDAGFVEHIIKPVDVASLRTILRRLSSG
jgi:PAS domain S-box-containing protein